jgi:hypothetical protein
MTTTTHTSEQLLAHEVAAVHSALSDLIDTLSDNPDACLALEDRDLAGIAMWTEDDEYPVAGTLAVRAECKRRRDYYAEQERRWASFGERLALIEDLPGDVPWTQAREVLTKRLAALASEAEKRDIVEQHMGQLLGDC